MLYGLELYELTKRYVSSERISVNVNVEARKTAVSETICPYLQRDIFTCKSRQQNRLL